MVVTDYQKAEKEEAKTNVHRSKLIELVSILCVS